VQVSGFSTIIQPPSQTQRPDVVERVQKDVQREKSRSNDERNNGSLEQLNARSEAILQQRIESSEASKEVNDRRRELEEDLPLNTRRALQVFADNSPSPEQQLGIELVGVDTFA
jgi:hypothetical protein